MPDNDPRSGPRLGFIGLGAMGGRMARRLLAAGYDLIVHDRSRATTVLSPSQKSKLDHARTGEYPATFPLRLMYKDFSLISQRALELSVAMPSTAAAAQVCAVEHARHEAEGDEDFSAVIRTVQQMAGLAEWAKGSEVPA